MKAKKFNNKTKKSVKKEKKLNISVKKVKKIKKPYAPQKVEQKQGLDGSALNKKVYFGGAGDEIPEAKFKKSMKTKPQKIAPTDEAEFIEGPPVAHNKKVYFGDTGEEIDAPLEDKPKEKKFKNRADQNGENLEKKWYQLVSSSCNPYPRCNLIDDLFNLV